MEFLPEIDCPDCGRKVMHDTNGLASHTKDGTPGFRIMFEPELKCPGSGKVLLKYVEPEGLLLSCGFGEWVPI